MTVTEQAGAPAGTDRLATAARDHLWMHFARMGAYQEKSAPVIVKGEGSWIWDSAGHRVLDGLSGLYVVQVGHGRAELAEVMARQAETLAFFPVWGYATEPAIELADRLAGYAPGDLNRVFFTTGGGEAVESAWKVAKQFFKLTGKPGKHKVISRATAYHGTTQGALAITGLPLMKQAFEPLTPGGFRVPNTNIYRAERMGAPTDPVEFGVWAADRIEEAILFEGADTVAAVFLEPVQNSGGCITAPPGYFQRVREICDRHDVLLVSDEVICAFGRHGTMFACEKFGYQPDLITCAKGMSSGYGPIGAMIASDRIMEPFLEGKNFFPHGYTFGGHPVSAAVSLANLDIFEREGLNQRVLDHEAALEATLRRLLDLDIVGDVRGDGYFWAVELVKDKATKETFGAAERELLVKQFLPGALFANGLYARPDDRGEPVIQVAPALTSGQAEFDEMERVLRTTLEQAQHLL
ncbi:aspartate aminotransferase family protein [Kineococcus sp. R8]|uniref:aspartate aminotransferase family protein n=1 Tax=Kineococcus siccus TaxID=2696567 RepID=UPI0014136ACA|nr:aspartate aminotransferase family protein [Kineococcus siccus]NAZ81128.1 aspartate aminotransferase family protein [Kineococcus siccus]